MPAKDCPHARRGDPNSHRDQLSLDPPIAPGGVFSCQTKDQRDRVRWNRRSSTPSVRVGPFPSHQFSMPAQQGLRLDKNSSPASNRQKPAQTCEHCSIRWLQCRTRHLSAQDGDLVAEHDDLDGQVLLLTTRETDQLKNAEEGNEEERECHAPSSSTESCKRKSRSTFRMTFSAPTRTVLEASLEDVLRPPSDVSRHHGDGSRYGGSWVSDPCLTRGPTYRYSCNC